MILKMILKKLNDTNKEEEIKLSKEYQVLSKILLYLEKYLMILINQLNN